MKKLLKNIDNVFWNDTSSTSELDLRRLIKVLTAKYGSFYAEQQK